MHQEEACPEKREILSIFGLLPLLETNASKPRRTPTVLPYPSAPVPLVCTQDSCTPLQTNPGNTSEKMRARTLETKQIGETIVIPVELTQRLQHREPILGSPPRRRSTQNYRPLS